MQSEMTQIVTSGDELFHQVQSGWQHLSNQRPRCSARTEKFVCVCASGGHWTRTPDAHWRLPHTQQIGGQSRKRMWFRFRNLQNRIGYSSKNKN